MKTPEEYWNSGEWKKAKPSIEDWFEFTKAYAEYHLKEYLNNTPQVIQVGDTNEFC